ncbi:MAG: hypothetical protein ACYS83_02305 [Planctomycetota bacterium]|jgi:hypothetical protein
METRKILAILVFALGRMAWPANLCQAEPMGTAFTYQGCLIDANEAADGEYDFQFKLYDDPCDGNQVGGDINKPDVDVIDAYFTVDLDFGNSVFDGNSVWLQIGVRPGEQNDPNIYTVLEPRQEVTPTPYALYARTASGAITGEGLRNCIPRFTGSSILDNSHIYQSDSGNVGIGIPTPDAKLEVNGQVKITGGSPGVGKVLTSDTEGLASWQTGSASADSDWMIAGDELYSIPLGNVGIGTASPSKKLHVNGQGRFDGALFFGAEGDAGTFTWGASEFIIKAQSGKSFSLGSNNTAGSLVIDTSGNVGIGTTNPDSKLKVAGAIHSTSGGFKFPDGTTQTSAAATDGHSLDAADGSPANAVYVDNSGKVGIGTTSPQEKVDIRGNAYISGNVEIGGSAIGGTSVMVPRSIDPAPTPGAWTSYIYVKDGITEFRLMSPNGTIYKIEVNP